MAANLSDVPRGSRTPDFATTRWSIVLAAGDDQTQVSRVALAQLCEAYWYPLYAYVRRRVVDVHEAQDLTQAFFSNLLERQTIAQADPERGRFRDFLLAALRNFLANEWDKARAAKRGGGKCGLSLDFDSGESRFRIEPSHDLTPEKLYERRWVLTLLEQVLERLRLELVEAGRRAYFEQFKEALTQKSSLDDYAHAAAALGITPQAARQAAYRLRKRYRELFRAEVARTVADESKVDDELARLLESFG
jgi:RNA polymerase sigma-70 factor (ECF subfamily)